MNSTNRQSQESPLAETTCVFDLFIDIPHPAASLINERAQIIEPPGNSPHPEVLELFDSSSISRIAMFSFPDYDAEKDSTADGDGEEERGILNHHDLNLFATTSFNHSFSLLLESGLRVYAHVLRYLPVHPEVKSRLDVGRRSERAMVLLTRTVCGEQFYTSLLKTIQAVCMQEMVATNDSKRSQRLVTAFLHAVYKRHFLLRVQCDTALKNKQMKILGEEYKILTIHGTEIYQLSFHDESGGGRQFMDKDIISLRLPLSLQPGYDGNNYVYECEVEDSPILPLLRCLGAGKTIRVLSAMLCEVRIIFISKYINTLSSCVTSAMSMLAQGLLVWRHVSITVLPPHLFRFLSAGAPYIVGVLDKYADRIDQVRGMKDVLCINLDKGDFKIYNMDEPKKKVPDLMEACKGSRKQKNYIGTEMLARDLNEVIEVDRKLWGQSTVIQATSDAMNKMSLNSTSSDRELANGLKKEKDDFFDAAAMFVETLQGTSLHGDKEPPVDMNTKLLQGNVDSQNEMNAKQSPRSRHFAVCDNEEGEEIIRASLLSFFLELYGDLGMYLLVNKSTGGLKVDKKKFLVRKSQMGFVDKTPMWYLLKQFSRGIMFERFISGRIEDADRLARGKPHVLLDHLPIFALCQKHLRKQKSNFTTKEIRDVVFSTVEGCPRHRVVENLEAIRNKALALTSEKPYEGDEVVEIKKLIESCKRCNLSFRQVMAVCWLRIGETRPHLWKQKLLGLHLLKNFVLHGPIASVSAAIDGIAEIYTLGSHDNKNIEATRSIRTSAMQLYFLLTNIALTFSRRRKALAYHFQKTNAFEESTMWSNYLIRRLPADVGFRHIHVMFSPSENIKPSSEGSKRSKELELKPGAFSAIPTRTLRHTVPKTAVRRATEQARSSFAPGSPQNRASGSEVVNRY